MTRRGVTVGANLRSASNRRVYAVGDAAGGAQFTHVAGYHAGVVIRQIAVRPARQGEDMAHIPRVTYTDPELAQVGLTEAEARTAHGDALTRAALALSRQRPRAGRGQDRRADQGHGGERPPGRGVASRALQAGELIGLWALAISAGLKMSAVAGMVAPYPTLGEMSKRAAGAYFSPKLFDSPMVKRVVGLVQRFLP